MTGVVPASADGPEADGEALVVSAAQPSRSGRMRKVFRAAAAPVRWVGGAVGGLASTLRRHPIISTAVGFMLLGICGLIFLPGFLLDVWTPGLDAAGRGKLLGPAANIVLFALGGVIAVVTVGISVARHRNDTAQLRVDAERELRSRFVTVVHLLASKHAIERQSGLHALSALADDWAAFGRSDEVDVCIRVLTSYLSAPLGRGQVQTPVDEVAVKSAGFAILGDHLKPGAQWSWSAKRIELERPTIDFLLTLENLLIHDDGVPSPEYRRCRFQSVCRGPKVRGTSRQGVPTR